jgi:hypothetical protein
MKPATAGGAVTNFLLGCTSINLSAIAVVLADKL